MKKVQLGNSDLKISQIGFGAMGMSEFYGPTGDAKEAEKLLQEMVGMGVDFIDTADVYGMGHNEELVGRAFKEMRDKVTIATKFGILRDAKTGAWTGLSGRPDYVKQACEASLKRLDTDVIDLYYLHRVDITTPIEETVGAMAELVKEGKVRYLGLSEVSGETLERACAVHPITAVQSEYSLWSRDIEETAMPTLEKLKVSLVAYSPLGRGFLTGKIKNLEDLDDKDYRPSTPRFQGDNFEKNLELVAEVEKIANAKSVTPAQISLAWVLAQKNEIVPIPGTKRRKYLMENIGAAEVALTNDELATLNSLSDKVAGTRYSAMGMKMVNI